jgi:hypothetical protein
VCPPCHFRDRIRALQVARCAQHLRILYYSMQYLRILYCSNSRGDIAPDHSTCCGADAWKYDSGEGGNSVCVLCSVSGSAQGSVVIAACVSRHYCGSPALFFWVSECSFSSFPAKCLRHEGHRVTVFEASDQVLSPQHAFVLPSHGGEAAATCAHWITFAMAMILGPGGLLCQTGTLYSLECSDTDSALWVCRLVVSGYISRGQEGLWVCVVVRRKIDLHCIYTLSSCAVHLSLSSCRSQYRTFVASILSCT